MGGSFQKELFENVDPDNVPEVLGGNCNWSKYVDTSTCEPDSTGTYWFLSDRGPWDDTPGDEFWEAAKSQLKGEDQKEEVCKIYLKFFDIDLFHTLSIKSLLHLYWFHCETISNFTKLE